MAVGENLEEFQYYTQSMLQTYDIFDAISGAMVRKIIDLGWRLNRFSVIESGILSIEMNGYERTFNKPLLTSIRHKDFHSHIQKKD